MSPKIQPSQFYYVNESVSLDYCLSLMKTKQLSFLLVENKATRLVGIFTLKDILKNYKAIQDKKNIEKPIKLFMTKPVITLEAHKIHQAPRLMIDKVIRHLPITSGRVGEESRIIGVVDIESLLAYSITEEKRKKYQDKDISVYSPNGSLIRLLKNILKPYELLKVDKLWSSKLRTEEHYEAQVHDYDIFFFDIIEERDLRLAMHFAIYMNKYRKRMICLLSPGAFKEQKLQDAVNKLAKQSRVRIFHKPVEIHDLIFECLS